MVSCAAVGCSNNSTKNKSEKVKGYHYIPSDKDLRKKWIIAMRREPPYPLDKNFALCGLHFHEDSFQRDLKFELVGGRRSFKLISGAVPSIFTFFKPISTRKTSEIRQRKRKKQDFVASVTEVLDEIPCSSSQTLINETSSEESDHDNSLNTISDEHDTTYDFEADIEWESSEIISESKFDLIFACLENLKLLFRFCSQCGSLAKITNISSTGVPITVATECTSGHIVRWNSIEKQKNSMNGNIVISSAILLSGMTYQPFWEAMNVAKVKMFNFNTFYRIQHELLFPSINNVYQKKRREIYKRTKLSGPVNLIGDGRCASPGFSATFGTYTLMNERNNEIIDFFIAHVRNAGNSQNMEKYGLKQLLDCLKSYGLVIETLTTDQHLQIRSFLRKEFPDICHQFDIWHRAKNLRKALEKVAKKKCFKELQPWLKSIVNHFWWSCSNCEGDVDKLRDMWASVLYHITNVHEWSDANSSYIACAHTPYSTRREMSVQWLKKSSPSYAALENIVLDTRLLNDLQYLVRFKHSGNLEVFHNLLLKYCPKRLSFTYKGMYARHQLAVIDHNSNLHRKQATSKDNLLRTKTQFSKMTGEWVSKKVMEPKSKEFINEIIDEITNVQAGIREPNDKLEDTPENIATSPNPGKHLILAKMMSRFKSSSSLETLD